ncbi:unnamed protein product, partial [Cuscuta campestris]
MPAVKATSGTRRGSAAPDGDDGGGHWRWKQRRRWRLGDGGWRLGDAGQRLAAARRLWLARRRRGRTAGMTGGWLTAAMMAE